jgi:hypothetical protein
MARAMQRPLLLAAGQARAGRERRSLTSSHRLAPRSDRSTTSVSLVLFLTPLRRRPAATLSKIDMVGNGFGALEDHPDRTPDRHRVDRGAVEVVVVQEHLALDARTGDHLVHAVEGPQERRLAAPARDR